MFQIIRSVCLASVTVFLFFVSSANAEENFGDFACNDEQLLRDSILYWMPVNEESGEIINSGCTLLPDSYEPTTIRVVDTAATADCVDNYCKVVIEEAVHNGLIYYIAKGWSEMTDPDSIEDLVVVGAPFVPIAIPCEKFACKVEAPIETANQ